MAHNALAESPGETGQPATASKADRTYADYVEKCRREESRDIVLNSSPDHARIVIQNLLTLAAEKKANVSLISGKLNELTYGPFADKATRILDVGANIQIMTLCDEVDLENNRFSMAVRSHSSRRGNIVALGKAVPPMAHYLLIGDLVD